MNRLVKRLVAFSALATAMALPAPAADEPQALNLKPRDLTPVTWIEAPAHAHVEIVRDGKPVAVVYVADPKGREKFVVTPLKGRARDMKYVADPQGSEFIDPRTWWEVERPIPALSRLVHELVEVVRLSTGAALPFVDGPPAVDQPAIVIGDCEESRRAGIDAAKIPIEGFVVKTTPNRMFLVGSSQALSVRQHGDEKAQHDGTAWAVADFLERFAGVRWYWRTEYGGRSIVRAASLAVPPVHYRDQPIFRMRVMSRLENPLQARTFDQGMLPMAPGILPANHPADHICISSHVPLWRCGASWPHELQLHAARSYEWAAQSRKAGADDKRFALKEDGARDYTVPCYSEPDTLASLLKDCEQAWDKGGGGTGWVQPSCVIVWAPMDLGGNPVGAACHCPACRAAIAKGGEELIVGLFVKRLCEEVKRRWPDKTVCYMSWKTKCPAGVKFPDNLSMGFLNADFLGLMHQPGLRRDVESRLRAWGAASGRPAPLWAGILSPSDWTYGPVQFPHVVQDFHLKNRDVLGGTRTIAYAAACWTTAAPTTYVLTRLLWNPELDVDATLDEMCRRLFGKAAGTARELLRLECERWEGTVLTRPLDITENRIPARLFREIWPADVVARMKALRDKALVEMAGDADARKAFLYWTWTFDAFLKDAEAIHEPIPAAAAPGGAGGPADPDAEARFRGGSAQTNAIRIANVRRLDGPVGGQSEVTFDLSWGNTWRAKWTEPAARNVTGKDLPLESWSAAWVFAKYRPAGRDENLGYSHATLSAAVADHGAAGATVDVGLTNGKGMGAFIYRARPGHGPLDLKGVKLRWLHAADGVADPGKADLKVFAIEMVYVPQGAFKVGSGGTESGSFTDGSRTAGPAVPFLVDANWSGKAADGTNARRIGKMAGRLWGTGDEGVGATGPAFKFGVPSGSPGADASEERINTVGPEGALSDGFPTGYEAFYCMRYELTRGQFADFLNAMSRDDYQSTRDWRFAHEIAHQSAEGRYSLSGAWPNLKPAKPYQACNLLSWWDGARFAAWAGLRPMTELEYEKACRGPLNPVPNEFAWGTPAIANAPYTVADEGKADERIAANYSAAAGNANYDFTMPDFYGGPLLVGLNRTPGGPMRAGVFATPESGRAAAGASYWGIMELSGNVREIVVTVGHARGRAFRGTHGAGTTHGAGALDVPDDWPEAKFFVGGTSRGDDAIGSGLRGGFFNDLHVDLRTSNRSYAAFRVVERSGQNGWRGVRTAPRSE